MSSEVVPEPQGNAEPQESLKAVRAMAHPVRFQLVERLGRAGQARATDLAKELGLATNAVSYHLRLLSRAGLIEETPGASGDNRNRFWQLVHSDFEGMLSQATPDMDAEQLAAAHSAVFEWVKQSYLTQLTQQTDPSDEDSTGPLMFGTSMRLSADEVKSFYRQVHSAIAEHQLKHRTKDGVDLKDEPGEKLKTYRVLFAITEDQ